MDRQRRSGSAKLQYWNRRRTRRERPEDLPSGPRRQQYRHRAKLTGPVVIGESHHRAKVWQLISKNTLSSRHRNRDVSLFSFQRRVLRTSKSAVREQYRTSAIVPPSRGWKSIYTFVRVYNCPVLDVYSFRSPARERVVDSVSMVQHITAFLIRASVGLSTADSELRKWDMHFYAINEHLVEVIRQQLQQQQQKTW